MKRFKSLVIFMVGALLLTLNLTVSAQAPLDLPLVGGREVSPEYKFHLPELNGGNPSDRFGSETALSADGNTAFVSVAKGGRRLIYVYKQIGNDFVLDHEFRPSTYPTSLHTGIEHIAINGAGDVLAMVESEYVTVGSETILERAAYIYKFDGNDWNLQARLIPDDSFELLDPLISLSADGLTLMMSALKLSTNIAYIFAWDGSTWTQQAILNPVNNTPHQRFGVLKLSGDGNTALIHMEQPGMEGPFTADLFIFRRTGSVWIEEHQFTEDYYTYSISVSHDGDRILFAQENSGVWPIATAGSVVYYHRNGSGVWARIGEIVPDVRIANDRFGIGVQMSSDGTKAVILSSGHVTSQYDGTVYRFDLTGNSWVQTNAFKPVKNTKFGLNTLALSADATTALWGIPTADTAVGVAAGAVTFATYDGSSWAERTELAAPYFNEAETDDRFGGAVAMSDDGMTVVIGSQGDDNEFGINAGSAYIYHKNGLGWDLAAILKSGFNDANSRDFGKSVAITPDGNTVVVISNRHFYTYVRQGTTWVIDAIQPTAYNNMIQISNDGNTLLLALMNSVVVYHRSVGGWIPAHTFNNPYTQGSFGTYIALSGDGQVAMVTYNRNIAAAPNPPNYVNAVHVYRRSGDTWAHHVNLSPSGFPNDFQFAKGVDINAAGDVAIVLGTQSGNPSKIVVFVYKRQGNQWHISAVLGEGLLNNAGAGAVALNTAGDVFIIGAYSFRFNGASWVTSPPITFPTPYHNAYYRPAAISGDGRNILVGFSLDYVNGNPGKSAGSAIIYYDDTFYPTETPTVEPTEDVTPVSTEEITPTPVVTEDVTPISTEEITPTPVVTEDVTPISTEEITPTPAHQEGAIIDNGGFEQIDNWTIKHSSGDKLKCNTATKTFAYEGECAFQFKNLEGEKGKLIQPLALDSAALAVGDTVRFSVMAKTKQGATVKAQVVIKHGDQAKDKIVLLLEDASEYREFVGETQLTDTVITQAVLKFKGTTTRGKVWIDAVQVTHLPATLEPLPTE